MKLGMNSTFLGYYPVIMEFLPGHSAGAGDRSAKGPMHMQCPNCLFHQTYADSVSYEWVPVPVTTKQRIVHAITGAFCSFAVLDSIACLISISLGAAFGVGGAFIGINLFVAAIVAYGCYSEINTVNQKVEVGSHWTCKHCDHKWTTERRDDLCLPAEPPARSK
jgi:hypothetical protein